MAKKKKDLAFQHSADVKLIIPCKGGYCYIKDVGGKMHHVKTDSEEFRVRAKALDEVLNGRVSREITELGWEPLA